MKKIKLGILLILLSLLASSCKQGCGCPGGAGYKQSKSQNNHQPKVNNISLFSA